MLSNWKLSVKWNTLTPEEAFMRNEGRSPRRHPQEGGYTRGDETRARIITAALRVFGEQGYVQASTRQIAASAGVNPPALQYYFDSKEGLHRACAQYIIDRVQLILSPALTDAHEAIRAKSREKALESLCGLLDALADSLIAAGSESWSRFIARGKADGAGPAMGMLRERIGVPLMEAVTQLIAIAGGAEAGACSDDVIRLRACAILGQVNTFYANRENTLAAMNWPEFDDKRLALIKSVVREHTCAALNIAFAHDAGAPQPAAK
jgi:AcrR family transcriptional regulator